LSVQGLRTDLDANAPRFTWDTYRRNLTDDQRAIITDELIERQSKISIAQQRSIAGKAGGRGRPKKDSELDAPAKPLKQKPIQTRKELSKKAKVSERKVKKARNSYRLS